MIVCVCVRGGGGSDSIQVHPSGEDMASSLWSGCKFALFVFRCKETVDQGTPRRCELDGQRPDACDRQETSRDEVVIERAGRLEYVEHTGAG